MVRTDGAPAAGSKPGAPGRRRGSWAKPIALIAGLLGALCAIAVPLLPVKVDHTTLSWPQQDSARSINAPLVSYAPLTFDVTVPGQAIEELSAHGGVLASTLPAEAGKLEKYGFVARVQPVHEGKPAQLEVVLRNQSLLNVPVAAVAGSTLTVHADMSSTEVELTGSGVTASELPPGDWRPQVVGLYSDLSDPAGASITAQVDSRFSVTPTILKRAAEVLAVVFTLIALVALYRLDRRDGRPLRRLLPQRWWTFTGVDLVVGATLVVWHFIGATTSDDGYQFGMARTSLVSGYMANYFRFFGVPENPVGTPPYDIIAHMTEISVASPWIRLPTLLAALVTWLALSREVIPRLGVAVRHDKVAVWTGALGFLAVWLPYNNGLRPEPIIAVCVLLTWCFVERAIATRRLLPYAIAILIAAFSFTAAPSGVICVAPLLAGLRSVVGFGIPRARALTGVPDGAAVSRGAWIRAYGALLAPLLAAGVLVLAFAFAVEPLSAMFEMQRVHSIVGPSDPWYNDYLNYQWLFMPSADGSIARRFGMVAMWLGLLVCIFVLLRKGGRIPFTAAGPARRLLGITFGAMVLMATAPTKFTHHNGVYAGLAGAVAVLTAVAVGPRVMRSPRNRALFAAVVSLAMAQIFTSINRWWFVSSFGMPWFDSSPTVLGIEFSTIFLVIAALCLLLAIWWHIRAPKPGTPHRVSPRAWRLAKFPPLTAAAAILVVFEVVSFAAAAVNQYPGFSLASSNINALTGNPCGLADKVLVETDPNASMMKPLTGDRFSTFTDGAQGFVPNGVGDIQSPEEKNEKSSISKAFHDDPGKSGQSGDSSTQTGGSPLPYGLDAATTPELGTYEQQQPADLITGWYRLPEQRDRSDIISIAAAGRIEAIGPDGGTVGGEPVDIEYGTIDSATTARPGGRVKPIDIGPAPSWRNLRIPLDRIPDDADVIRIVAKDHNLDPQRWVALTPPRIPQTQTLNDLIGSSQPVLLDWAVGLQFPCQRPFDHKDGIAQVPGWRILPNRAGANDTTMWQSHSGGGPLGWSQQLLRSRSLATYLRDDWKQDWGELQRLTPIDPTAGRARPAVTQETHGGLWSPGPINTW
ncbi:arabinosyltransferase domain-containing protein [Nocardia vermiculata]|uniref:Arabinosyltransferase n=1 Tax=Nocardia vermiculata TaxID=257274 RepID=A0A846XW63_9NOCA|nr:arabinosyltransferase domain-containing protein [Nocardia vermiculata]NKY49631.1 arabinosyltransferase [Nocardia vermiculata]